MFLTIFTFIFILSILVFVHEFGHFWTARKFGLIPEEFGFGFPPRIGGFYKSKDGTWKYVKGKKNPDDAIDTIYSINWLPLGGFVKLGEDDTDIPEDANHFHNKPAWQRAIMLLAGVTMNMFLAVVLISFGYLIGLPQVIDDNMKKNAIVQNQQIQIVEVMPDTPADQAGLKIGDIILGADQKDFTKSDEVQDYSNINLGNEISYKIKRGQEEMAIAIVPTYIEEAKANGIGIGIVNTGLVRYPIHLAIWEGAKSTFELTKTILVAFGEMFKKLVTGKGMTAEVAGPVGIAVLTGQVARMGFVYILQFAALLSVNLAIINAFPFPALDGGRVLFLLIEKIKGSPIKREVEGTIHYIGFALLMLLVLVVTLKDVARFGDNLKLFWDKIF